MASREAISAVAEGFCWLDKRPLEALDVPDGPATLVGSGGTLTLEDGSQVALAGPMRVRPLGTWGVCPACGHRYRVTTGPLVTEQVPLRPEWPGLTVSPPVVGVIVSIEGDRYGPVAWGQFPLDADYLEIEWTTDSSKERS